MGWGKIRHCLRWRRLLRVRIITARETLKGDRWMKKHHKCWIKKGENGNGVILAKVENNEGSIQAVDGKEGMDGDDGLMTLTTSEKYACTERAAEYHVLKDARRPINAESEGLSNKQ
ncbi:hypothetical protein CDL12_03814 [Handroanthus impetiginosus]|uniref:Uncharacterized protein n=1 Tax=Handroanthus impetiginosus TaxID=429701 RepID=A0A2G9I136_9LAMI|nr:hypothetical protein CDL12_03814 [Handroanthus impetiginosus]